MSEEQKDTRTATQRLDDLERVVASLYSAVNQLIQVNDKISKLVADIPLLHQAVKLLNRRIEGVVRAASESAGITIASVSAEVVKMNLEELKAQVAQGIADGHLSASEVITDTSFAVVEEFAPDGTVASERTQFPVGAQPDEVKAQLLGKKVGDTASFGPEKFSLKVLEVYQVNEPKAPEAAAVEAPAMEQTAAAPAEAPAPEAAPAPAEAPVADTSTTA